MHICSNRGLESTVEVWDTAKELSDGRAESDRRGIDVDLLNWSSLGCRAESLIEGDPDLGVDFIDRWGRVDLDDLAFFSVHVDDGHGSLDKSPESLDDGFIVIIGPAGSLASFEETITHDLLGGVEEEDKAGLTDLVSALR